MAIGAIGTLGVTAPVTRAGQPMSGVTGRATVHAPGEGVSRAVVGWSSTRHAKMRRNAVRCEIN